MAERLKTAAWATGSNIYEVNLRQYTKEGTFAAFQNHLPRLKDMGVKILWFMPITPISIERRQGALGSYYACSDYTSTNPEFGTLQEFESLVADAHVKGFKVIIDWVVNHTGWDHTWTRQHPEFYKKDSNGKFYDSNGWQDVIDLDYTNKDLWKALIDAMKFWVKECDVDGFRCDMAHLIPLQFWHEARTELDKEKELFWLAETEEPTYHEVFDASYTWEMLHTMEALYRGETSKQGLFKVLENYKANFPTSALRAYFTSNHDENSHSGSEYERLGDAAKAFAVLCVTLPNSIPLIYNGQELPNKKRLNFFDKDLIEWTSNCQLHDFYRNLLSLLSTNTALTNGEMTELKTSAPDSLLAFVRKHNEKQVFVLMNLSYLKLNFAIEDPVIKDRYKSVFSGLVYDFTANKKFEMQPWEYMVYEK